jgi:hypothetical protein
MQPHTGPIFGKTEDPKVASKKAHKQHPKQIQDYLDMKSMDLNN